MSKFQKFDGKKNRIELIEPEFIEGLGRILSFGADKYEANNWMKASSKEDQDRIYGALQRHLLAYKKGEKLDSETGESHLYHACCNLMFLDYQDRQNLDFDLSGAKAINTDKMKQMMGVIDTVVNADECYLRKTAEENVFKQALKEHGDLYFSTATRFYVFCTLLLI